MECGNELPEPRIRTFPRDAPSGQVAERFDQRSPRERERVHDLPRARHAAWFYYGESVKQIGVRGATRANDVQRVGRWTSRH